MKEHVAEIPPKAIKEAGGLFALGDHGLLSGDSTNSAHVQRALGSL